MEGSESEQVFKKLNLNPQLFINEVLNLVDDVVHGAFDFFHEEASKLLKPGDAEKAEDLKLGINHIHSTIQSSLDKRLILWEQYCLRHCFAVPTGFSLPSENEASCDDLMDEDDINDERVNAQLDSLRNKLAEAGKECSELNNELIELETKSALASNCASGVNEALQLYETNSAQNVFQEMQRVASELRQKMDQLKTKQKIEIEHNQRDNADEPNGALSMFKSDDIQEFIAEMNL